MGPSRHRSPIRTLAAVAVVVASLAGVPSTAGAQQPEADGAAAGLDYSGLRPGGEGSPCGGLYEIRLGTRLLGCTHGPDAAPGGVDVRRRVGTDELRARAAVGRQVTDQRISCVGDGTTGKRVQAIYARASDVPDRYAQVAPLIRSYADAVHDVVNASAGETGGRRAVRWVTSSCQLSVANVVLSAAGDDSFANTMSELRSRGFTSSSRKYLVWMDANVLCGIGQLYTDDQPGSGNTNNGIAGVPGMYARIDAPCWGQLSNSGRSVEAHELVHTLGGVQPTAPNGTQYAHCDDEWDTMCYQDGSPGLVMTHPCAYRHDALLDCGHSDYFHTSPPSGSWLATHWNTASSGFLSPVIAPPNDAFAAAQVFAPVTASWVGANVGATAQTGEPGAAGQLASRSVWYRVTSPAAGGTLTFDTQGSTFDTVVGVYHGSTVGGLTLVASNDNHSGATWSRVSLATSPNTTYHIKVDGRGGASGAIIVHLGFGGPGPTITSFSPSTGAPGTHVTINGTNLLGSGSGIRLSFNGFGITGFVSASQGSVVVAVPAGARTGPIFLSTAYGHASTNTNFTVS